MEKEKNWFKNRWKLLKNIHNEDELIEKFNKYVETYFWLKIVADVINNCDFDLKKVTKKEIKQKIDEII